MPQVGNPSFPAFSHWPISAIIQSMLVDLLKEFVLELLRALFLEDLCQRVKNQFVTRAHQRRLRRHQALLRWLHLRHRDRLLHRLITGAVKEL